MNWKLRLRSYGLWISVSALVLMVLNLFGVQVVESTYNDIVNTILTILVTLGILNNPTTRNKGFGDD